MLCGETVDVYCENRTEHTDTMWAVRTSQETHRYTVCVQMRGFDMLKREIKYFFSACDTLRVVRNLQMFVK
jgi:hypothetical protein